MIKYGGIGSTNQHSITKVILTRVSRGVCVYVGGIAERPVLRESGPKTMSKLRSYCGRSIDGRVGRAGGVLERECGERNA